MLGWLDQGSPAHLCLHSMQDLGTGGAVCVKKGREMRRCFECWRIGVPPAWLVVCGALLVQVKNAQYILFVVAY